MITSANVTVTNPEDTFGSPAYDGPSHLAHTMLTPGTYEAAYENGTPVRLVVSDRGTTVYPVDHPGRTATADGYTRPHCLHCEAGVHWSEAADRYMHDGVAEYLACDPARLAVRYPTA